MLTPKDEDETPNFQLLSFHVKTKVVQQDVRKIERQADRQTDRQTDRKTKLLFSLVIKINIVQNVNKMSER